MRIALGLEYDGSLFCGWQSQPSGCAVQDALERALSGIAGQPLQTVTAGRTDSGVHALAQVVHFDCEARRPATAWVRGGNALLPTGVSVHWAQPVPEAFHARFSAVQRCYRYVLLNAPVRPGLLHGKVGWFHGHLDLEKMQEAARCLLGEHDFSAFRAAECQAKSPVRQLHKLEIRQQGRFFVFELCANAFLHHMVRNLVGSLVYVGKGKHSPAWLQEILAGRNRARAAPTFSPAGLYLEKIHYGPEWGLPEFEPDDWLMTSAPPA